MRIVVTGGAGFIGSAVCRLLLSRPDVHLVILDKMTYAANPLTVRDLLSRGSAELVPWDIADADAMAKVFSYYNPDAVLHLAAESHVDRSLDGPEVFLRTNVLGTFTLLQAARRYWMDLPADRKAAFRFVHVSTDEVFGALGDEGVFTEQSRYQPNSPYSASKAASDHLARAWHESFGLPVITTNCSNNYGPYQFPEKLIPLMILNALEGKLLPVYGTGMNVRDWLHVEDHAAGILKALDFGRPGEVYLFGGLAPMSNIEVVEMICDLLDEKVPHSGSRRSLITFVADRPGHDHRYAVDSSKSMRDLAWSPRGSFRSGLSETIDWYIANASWWEPIRSQTYRGERLGSAAVGRSTTV